MTRALNEAALSLIQKYEGFISKWYPDPVHGWKVPTCCYGHTDAAGPPFYKDGKNKKFTRAEGAEILARDLRSYADAVEKAVKVPLTDNQFGALVSFTYNLGPGNLRKSTLLKKLNAGDVTGAANAFLSWNKAAGKVMKGLTTRREAERKLFMSNSAQAPQPTAAKPVETAPVRTDSILARGHRGPIIADLQHSLNTLGYGPLKVDEHFGENTEKAVMSFQLDNGLKVDGIAGGRTSTAIGKAIADKELKPAIEKAEQKAEEAEQKVVEAEKTVPETAREEVKEKTSFWSWLLGALGVGGGGLSAISGAQWQTVVAIGGVAVVALVVMLIMRRQIIEAFKDINREAKS